MGVDRVAGGIELWAGDVDGDVFDVYAGGFERLDLDGDGVVGGDREFGGGDCDVVDWRCDGTNPFV